VITMLGMAAQAGTMHLGGGPRDLGTGSRRTLLALSVWAALASACGRLGFDAQGPRPIDGSVDGATEGPADAAIDTAGCPVDMTAIAPGGAVCIELAQRGIATWTNAMAACTTRGRRLCGDAEWHTACLMATGLSGMVGDDYEWVAEESGGFAQKRGATSCEDKSTHEILVDPYGYRCCVDG
jgi:hypothetical protein